MDHFAGLDVSVKETSVCIVDDTGRIVREVKVASEPEALLQILSNPAYRFKRTNVGAVGLSASAKSSRQPGLNQFPQREGNLLSPRLGLADDGALRLE